MNKLVPGTYYVMKEDWWEGVPKGAMLRCHPRTYPPAGNLIECVDGNKSLASSWFEKGFPVHKLRIATAAEISAFEMRDEDE